MNRTMFIGTDLYYSQEFVDDRISELNEKDKEIERLNNKVEELMTLYTTEREVKEDYKVIIKEALEYLENETWFNRKDLLKILKGEDKE